MTNELARDDGRNWSAFSLPFAVGQNGRIGRLRAMLLNPEPARNREMLKSRASALSL